MTVYFTDQLQWLYWLLDNQWAFWIIINLGALLAYCISLYTIVGIVGLLYPVVACIATIVLGHPWWVGYIGVASVLIAFLPFFLVKTDP